MNAQQKEQVKTMLQMKANKKLVQQHIRKETGHLVSLKDLHNLCGKEKGAPAVNLEAVVNELRRSKVVEVLEKEGVLQALFYQRREWQHTYKTYPEVILIDATYKLNDLRMPLYLMLCVDGNGESEVVAMWLVNSEDKLTMKAMVSFFKKHNDVEKTTCVMADKDWVERDVIEEELPHANLLICLFHTLRTFRREVSEKAMGINQDQRHLALEVLEKLAYSANDAEYATNKAALLELDLPNVTNYFLKQWDGIRHQRVEGLKNNAKHLMNNTNNRLESINQKIKDVVGRRLDLLQFFKELLTYFDSMSQERDHRAVVVFAKIPVDLYKDNPLADYQRHLTPYAFLVVKKQHDLSRGVSIPDGSDTLVQMERSDGLLTISTTACECGFFRAMSLPCRHIFALRQFHGLSLFSSESCAQRWTRNYYKEHRVLINHVEIHDVHVTVLPSPASVKVPSQHEKYRAAFQHAQKLASVCSELPLRQFLPSLQVLEQLANAWQEGKHVTLKILSESDLEDAVAPVTSTELPQEDRSSSSDLGDAVAPVTSTELPQEDMSSSSDLGDAVAPVTSTELPQEDRSSSSDEVAPVTLAEPRALRDIKLPPKMLKRGRPKGADLTVIGLPKKRKVPVVSQPQPFVTLSDKEKDMTILDMIDGDKTVMTTDRLLTVTDIIGILPCTLLEDCINVNRIKKYFERAAFIVLKAKLELLKQSAVWLCGHCREDTALHTKAVACDRCLQWYHAKCVGTKRKVSKSRFWFCKNCTSKQS